MQTYCLKTIVGMDGQQVIPTRPSKLKAFQAASKQAARNKFPKIQKGLKFAFTNHTRVLTYHRTLTTSTSHQPCWKLSMLTTDHMKSTCTHHVLRDEILASTATTKLEQILQPQTLA